MKDAYTFDFPELGKNKNRTIVEYALHDARKPIGVATCEIIRTLPRALKGQLPSPQDIAHLLEDAGHEGSDNNAH